MTSAQETGDESDVQLVDGTAGDEIGDDSQPSSTTSTAATTTTSQVPTTTTTTTTEASDQTEEESEPAGGEEDQTETENMQGDDPSAGVSASPGMFINLRKIRETRSRYLSLQTSIFA